MTADGYAGDISPKDTFEALKADPKAVLIDVRTVPEWQFVGVPDLATVGKEVLFVEWQTYPAMQVNGGFVKSVAARGIDKDQPLYLLCRSGVRSRAAAIALTAAGYATCYNIATGFEGALDDKAHRGTVGGWKHAGLPWRQQ
ncbi:MAG: rhodanese-like domain-containing protein [Pseudomonadota bacterium]|nr:rhodanese-like domain-containing protein [Pseudomonadota bacterium]